MTEPIKFKFDLKYTNGINFTESLLVSSFEKNQKTETVILDFEFLDWFDFYENSLQPEESKWILDNLVDHLCLLDFVFTLQ